MHEEAGLKGWQRGMEEEAGVKREIGGRGDLIGGLREKKRGVEKLGNR